MAEAKRKSNGVDQLTGPQKSAVLCMALGTAEAAKVFQQLTAHEVEMVSKEIATLPTVGSEAVNTVLKEFTDLSKAVHSVAHGGLDAAQRILETAVGPGRAKIILEKIQEQMVDTGLKRLRRAAPDVLAGILRGEHPQTIALILAHLDVRQASSVVEVMDAELAAEVLYRVARMEKISPEILAVVESGLSSKTDLSLSEEMTLSGGPGAVAKVLNIAGGSLEKQLLEGIEQRSGELAQQIQALMFTFEDLLLIDARGMQRLLGSVDTKELALAMKACSDELRAHIKQNMSERASSALDEEIEFLGPVRVKDVEAAHTRIIEVVRSLEEKGEIMVRSRGGTDDIIA